LGYVSVGWVSCTTKLWDSSEGICSLFATSKGATVKEINMCIHLKQKVLFCYHHLDGESHHSAIPASLWAAVGVLSAWV